MRYLLFILFVSIAFPTMAAEDPFGEYEAGMYDEANVSNDVYYSVYYQNKIKKAFREMEKNEEALLLDVSDATPTTDNNGSVYIASPIIHPDSKVKEIYIKNEMNSDVYVKND